jgi:hypothetical protein
MKNEVYVWMLIIVAIVSVALYARYFYQPAVSIALAMNANVPSQFYPYQKATVNIDVFNNGSSVISNMSIGIVVNENLTTLYKVTLPVGKQTSLSYNYSPLTPGTYAIKAVADPGRLYNIADRDRSQASVQITVLGAQNATPGDMLPPRNAIALHAENLTRGGYLLSTYLYDQYNVSNIGISDNGYLNGFLTPVLNLTSYYIKNISITNADYENGTSAQSIWIKGYLAPNIFSVAASASGLRWKNYTADSTTVTLVNVGGNATFCSWYSGGWLKTLSYAGGKGTCMDVFNGTESAGPILPGGISNALSDKISIANASELGSYSGIGKNGAYAARSSFFNNASFIYASIMNNTLQSDTCYGIISIFNGTYYCSTYLMPKSGGIQALSLIRTTTFFSKYNLTVMSLVNTSLALREVPETIALMKGFNITGTSLVLKSGITNVCSFDDTFGCGNVSYSDGTVTFRATNRLNQTLRLDNAECYTLGSVIPLPVNITLEPMQSTDISTACYGLSGKLSGFALNLHLKLALNYSVANLTNKVLGSAFIPIG